MSDPAKTAISPLDAIYERYKHLSRCLSDPEWCKCGDSAGIYVIAGELWRAIKETRETSDQRIASAIAELEQQLTADGEEIPGHGNAAIKYAILLLKGGKK